MKNLIILLSLAIVVSCSQTKSPVESQVNNSELSKSLDDIQPLTANELSVTALSSNQTESNINSGKFLVKYEIKNISNQVGKVKMGLTYSSVAKYDNLSSTCQEYDYSKLNPGASCIYSIMVDTDLQAGGIYPFSFSILDKDNGNLLTPQFFINLIDPALENNNSGSVCKVNYHTELRKCLPNVKSCSAAEMIPISASAGTKNWISGTNYSSCKITQCVSNYILDSDANTCSASLSMKKITINKVANQGIVYVFDLFYNEIGMCSGDKTQCVVDVNLNQGVSIVSSGLSGFGFANYADSNCLGTNMTCNLSNVAADIEINPIFVTQNPRMYVSINPFQYASNITYSVTKNNVSCDSSCMNNLNAGDNLSLIASPDSIVSISSITANGNGITNVNTSVLNSISFTMGLGDAYVNINAIEYVEPQVCSLENYATLSPILFDSNILTVSGMTPNCLVTSCSSNFSVAQNQLGCIAKINKIEFYDVTNGLEINVVSPYTQPALNIALTQGEIRKIMVKNAGTYSVNPNNFSIMDYGTQAGQGNVVTIDPAQSAADLRSCNNVTNLLPESSCNLYVKFSYLYDSVSKDVVYDNSHYAKYNGSINFVDSKIGTLSFSLSYAQYSSIDAPLAQVLTGKLYVFDVDDDMNPDWWEQKKIITNMPDMFTQDQIQNEMNSKLEFRMYVLNAGQNSMSVNPHFTGSSLYSVVGHTCSAPLIPDVSQGESPTVGSYCYVDVKIDFSSITDYSETQYIEGSFVVGDQNSLTSLPAIIGIKSNSGIFYRDRHFVQHDEKDSQGNSLYPQDAPYITKNLRVSALILPNYDESEGTCATYNSGTQSCSAYNAPVANYTQDIYTEKTYNNEIRLGISNGTNHSINIRSNPIMPGSAPEITNYVLGGGCVGIGSVLPDSGCTYNIGFRTTIKPGLFNIKLQFSDDPADPGIDAFVNVECDPDKSFEEIVNGEKVCSPNIRECDMYIAGTVPMQCDSDVVLNYNTPVQQFNYGQGGSVGYYSVNMFSNELVQECRAIYQNSYGLSVQKNILGHNGKAPYIISTQNPDIPNSSSQWSQTVFVSQAPIGKGRQIWSEGKWSMCHINSPGVYYSGSQESKPNIFPDNSDLTSECYEGYTKKHYNSGGRACQLKVELNMNKCMKEVSVIYDTRLTPRNAVRTTYFYLWYPDTRTNWIPEAYSWDGPNGEKSTRNSTYSLQIMKHLIPFSDSILDYDYSVINHPNSCPASIPVPGY